MKNAKWRINVDRGRGGGWLSCISVLPARSEIDQF